MSDEERNLIEILEENIPIDISKLVDYVHSPHCGAIATFAGTTRDTFEGKTVLELRYEAYVPMAIRCIKSICTSARSSWNLSSIAVAHRLGPVPVGETSIFVAISSVHRADALDACKFVIDEIKASVPIWKKEVYTNGEVWKENSEFLERREELQKPLRDNGSVCCGMKVFVEEGCDRRGCCGGKVKINNGKVWKENSEFLERRDELQKPSSDNGSACSGRKVFVEGHSRRGCCGGKVKIIDEIV